MSPPPREPSFLGLAHVRRYRIVVGIDLSEYADIVIEHALDQAARHDAPELHFLTVKEKKKVDSGDLKQALWERVYPALETFNKHHFEWRARLHVCTGAPDEQIALLAADVNADLIVMGQFGLHKRNLPHRVIQAASCPTLVVGMPEAADTAPRCAMCHLTREETDGARWFCSQHSADDRREHTLTAMTTWSGGELVWG